MFRIIVGLTVMSIWIDTVGGAVVTPFSPSPFIPDRSATADEIGSRAVQTRDTRYAVWPIATTTGIPYRMDPTYSATERSVITQALGAISSDLNQCIKFVPYNRVANANQDHIYLGKTFNNGTIPLTCFSFPGRLVAQQGSGQKLALFSGVDGCLGSVKDAMGYIVHVLGLRDEIKRPDRDASVQVFPQNVKPALLSANVLQPYTSGQVDLASTAFDFNSITIPPPEKFAFPGVVLYTARVSGRTVGGSLPRLSLGDCQAISALYAPTCKAALCVDPYSGTDATSATSATSATVPSTTSRGPLEPIFPGFTR
ncbi:hypothetical protein BV898_04423 [Hypsibius exemplaris]|uniref:Peptidase M12A domain-containing protein n=1 Tax=Hypsibius exemplaris TaxID=2072580 RepID=A0A1W0X279_HYPEX|nr:hypothetical protein BV898_04423 [Hypsibius exemplaris]